ncbi:metal-dependent hydrolase [Rhizorhabdus phycosphaerae]|uniref:metal-dependent hydrolase n=1 Tax=Rhizorhabdus phycosphaerae TaxID=2711156 RepID=UPI0013EB911A|nr:metal-dependent hydrolase [Rhizorhabdus phycosphaerae]
MQARNPRIIFEDALPHWAPDRAFAQIVNAGSLIIPAVEIFLNKVMARALSEISDPATRRDVEIFMAQEGNHYRYHRLFNKVMVARYPELRAFDAELTAEYEAMLKTRSLRDCAAYCEGFESLGLIQAEFFFGHVDDLLEGADTRIVRLWQWHLAEEFEHRSVCFDVHRQLGGGYLSRVRGFALAARHLGQWGKRVSDHLIACDTAALDAASRARLNAEEQTYRRRLLRFSLPRILAVLSPAYDPGGKAAPRGSIRLLESLTAP